MVTFCEGRTYLSDELFSKTQNALWEMFGPRKEVMQKKRPCGNGTTRKERKGSFDLNNSTLAQWQGQLNQKKEEDEMKKIAKTEKKIGKGKKGKKAEPEVTRPIDQLLENGDATPETESLEKVGEKKEKKAGKKATTSAKKHVILSHFDVEMLEDPEHMKATIQLLKAENYANSMLKTAEAGDPEKVGLGNFLILKDDQYFILKIAKTAGPHQ